METKGGEGSWRQKRKRKRKKMELNNAREGKDGNSNSEFQSKIFRNSWQKSVGIHIIGVHASN